MTLPSRIASALTAVAALCAPFVVHCQSSASYPDKPVRVVVPYPAGGYYDRVARIMAEVLRGSLKQTFVVENRVGANGVIGADFVARAPADGYTLLLAAVGPNAISPVLTTNIPYDATRDFAPVSLLVSAPNVLVVPASSKIQTVAQLREHVTAMNGKANYAHNGVGSSTHLAMELFKGAAGLRMNPIPYKGSAPAVIALAGGEVDAAFGSVLDVLPLIEAGRLRALAVGGQTRLTALPEVPTVGESGLPGFDSTAWSGVMAPANTPLEILAKLNSAVNASLSDPAVVKRLSPGGELEILGGSIERFSSYLAQELVKWRKVVKENGIQTDS